MTLKAYSVGCKRKVGLATNIKVLRRLLPNGQVVTIICGKSKKCGVVCSIVSNEKAKPCKNGKTRGKNGRC